MTLVQGTQFGEYTDQLQEMANVLRQVASQENGTPVAEVLRRAADEYGTTPSQMKYALSFAGVRKLVRVDYDSGTVSAT